MSRLILFKKLIKVGLGYVMLIALKSIYVSTSCILDMNGKKTQSFRTQCGIRLNLRKSDYLVIGGRQKDEKLKLSNDYLEYKNTIKYLGVIISDTGNNIKDIQLFIQKKRADMYTKYTNFCAKDYLCPLRIKLKVLHTCMMTSI